MVPARKAIAHLLISLRLRKRNVDWSKTGKANRMARKYSIRELATEFDVTTRTIRFYEEKGLLNPQREGTRRIYSAADRTKLRLILRGKRLGLSLDESAEIIHMYGTTGNNRRQLEKLVSKIQEKRAELKRQQLDLRAMLKELTTAEDKCRRALAGLES
jgi:DNA-binding transcriptional MerR regulator